MLRYSPVPLCERHHVFDTGAHRVHIGDCSGDTSSGINVSQRGIFPAGDKDRKILVSSGYHPTVVGINFIKFLQPAFSQNLEKKLMWKTTFAFLRRGDPFVDYDALDTPNRFLFRNTSVGNAVE